MLTQIYIIINIHENKRLNQNFKQYDNFKK